MLKETLNGNDFLTRVTVDDLNRARAFMRKYRGTICEVSKDDFIYCGDEVTDSTVIMITCRDTGFNCSPGSEVRHSKLFRLHHAFLNLKSGARHCVAGFVLGKQAGSILPLFPADMILTTAFNDETVRSLP